ncbi:MAG: leucine-rich repeat domain-containing protein [Ruminococcus sp.]|nr:leucine-rich repeat domain-containing protein [Ruminococcus sp.]
MKGKVLRKTLAAALALLLVSGNVPLKPVTDLFSGAAITASAATEVVSGTCGANAAWSLDDEGKLTITGTGAMYDYTSYSNVPWYANRANITSVEITDSITSIGNYAFEECTGLTSVTLPDSLTSIGSYAFRHCTGLTSINIPKNVTSIGSDAFYACTGITNVYCLANPTNLTWTDGDCDDFILPYPQRKTTRCHVPAAYLSGYNSKYNKDSVGKGGTDVNVTFVDDIQLCGDSAYWSFDSETGKLTIGGTGAMYDYTSDSNVPWYANRPNITSVEIADGITSIGNYAFEECTGLTSVTLPDSLTSIGVYAFYDCECLTSITLPDSLTSIGDVAFYYCTGLKSVTIPDSVTSIGVYAFWNCTSLTSITIPDGVTSIGDYVFYNCTGLTSVTLPDGVTSIGQKAFQYCTGLTSINIPKNVTSIGIDAFYDCTNITDVYCYADPANLTWNDGDCDDFIRPQNSKTTVCHVPEEHIGDYNSEKFSNVNVTFKAINPTGECGEDATWEYDLETNKLTISGTGSMYDYDPNNQPWYNYKDNITSVVIEDGITSIGNSAFNSCAKLTSVSIPDSVKSIGNYAFDSCESLKSITIPEKVTSIGEYVFAYCEGLESVEIGSNVESIGADAFFDCTSLTSVTIPDSVKSIGGYAFSSCTSLESITIPDSVTSIGKEAFFNCTNIKDVYCYADPANLTWNDGDCDDFIRPQNSKTTVCHVPAEYIGDYNSEKFSDVNVTFVGDLVDMGLGEHLYGHSITLDGSIGVNFYVELTGELLASNTAEMVFTVPSGSKTETQTLLVKDVIAEGSNKVVIGGKTYYKFKCSVSAKDMASTITAQLVDGEKSGTKYTYSVKDYADYLLTHTDVEEYANAAPLVKTMLSYGAYSQQFFGEGTPLADSYKGNVSDVAIPATFKYNAEKTDLPENVTLDGVTLSLMSETTLSLYFKGLPKNTEFLCSNGNSVETVFNGEYVIARIRGIKANDLDSIFTVTFTGGSVEYSPMTYCYNVLTGGSTDEKLQNVCKVLYQYAQAANEYFGGNN